MSELRDRMHEIIFEADTRAGRIFDLILLVAIVLSVTAVVLESVGSIKARFGTALAVIEWVFTILFTLEYVLRLWTVRRPLEYAKSFLGVVDLLAIAPAYLGILLPGGSSFLVIRSLRLLRVFRVFKISRYVGELSALAAAVRATRVKIAVFLFVVLTLVLIMGTVMYVVEGSEGGFDSIPRGMYWAIVTVTTVGYGDIAPRTLLGQTVAAAAMIIGYSLIIIPTGIFSVELVRAAQRPTSTQACRVCSRDGHDADAVHCKFCGERL